MGKFILVFVAVLSIWIGWIYHSQFSDLDPPVLTDNYWGPEEKRNQKEITTIHPFKIDIPDTVLTDLKTRLRIEIEGNRLTPPLEGIGFQYGFNTKFLQTVTNHWFNKYDWRAREKILNKYLHFKTSIEGIQIHYLHIKNVNSNKYKATKPLLLLHGWPGSIVEFQKLIPLLTEPKDSQYNYELVIPSLPGYGFSERAHRPGLGPVQIAQIFVKLMNRLGHTTFYVHGGDWGGIIGAHMASLFPKHVAAFHTNFCLSFHPKIYLRLLIASFWPSLFVDEDEISRSYPIGKVLSFQLEETGYMHLQASKPDTIGVALSNSPSGLAAYILEKFSTWTNSDWREKENGGLLPYYNLDDLLDNVMIYWVSNSITSSMRLYSENFNKRTLSFGYDRVPVYVPSGCISARNEFVGQPKFQFQETFRNILSYKKVDKGGHFAVFEVPEIVGEDIIQFFNLINKKE